MVSTAFIKLWGETVGAIAWNPITGLGTFEYDADFASHNWDIAPVKMPINTPKGTIFSFPDLKQNTTFRGLPGLLADVLPDRYGNAIINAWLAKNNRPMDSLNPVEMLCFIGNRGMGALTFEPMQPQTDLVASEIEIAGLVNIASEILNEKENFNTQLNDKDEQYLHDILKIGTSAGGARAKAIIAYNEKTKEVRSGQATIPPDFKQWIIKFDGISDQQFGASFGYGRVEMAYYLMAKDAGLQMMPSMLYEEHGRAHFMTQRFDRLANNEKVHVQSFCAMQHFDFNEVNFYSYEQLFETMRFLRLPYGQAQQMYRRMVFNVLARNCDDHTKNFSFIMDKSGNWNLAPSFDICHAYRANSIWVSQHALSINGKRKDFTQTDLMSLAYKMNIKNAKTIIAEVKATVSNWQYYAGQVSVSTDLAKAIETTLLAKEF